MGGWAVAGGGGFGLGRSIGVRDASAASTDSFGASFTPAAAATAAADSEEAAASPVALS